MHDQAVQRTLERPVAQLDKVNPEHQRQRALRRGYDEFELTGALVWLFYDQPTPGNGQSFGNLFHLWFVNDLEGIILWKLSKKGAINGRQGYPHRRSDSVEISYPSSGRTETLLFGMHQLRFHDTRETPHTGSSHNTVKMQPTADSNIS
jgi:hypothetical protein